MYNTSYTYRYTSPMDPIPMVYLSCQVAQVLKPGSLGRTGPTGHEICGAEIFRSRRGPRREDPPTQGYIPWQIHGRNGIFTDPWMVDVYGKFVGKSTNPPWLLWVRLKMKSFCSNFLGSPWSWYVIFESSKQAMDSLWLQSAVSRFPGDGPSITPGGFPFGGGSHLQWERDRTTQLNPEMVRKAMVKPILLSKVLLLLMEEIRWSPPGMYKTM